ncbi:MAG: GNAT family N-acetyltransferase [Candidatus Bathyarchaeia archaeon]
MDELMNPDIRLYRPGDEDDIVRLLDLCFEGWPKIDVNPLEYWRWKYVDSPFWKNDISLGILDGEIIACKHSLYFGLKIGDEVLEATLGSDLAVHPDYRNMGVSRKVSGFSSNRKMKLGYDFSYFVTSNPHLIKSYQERLEEFPHEIRVYVRICDVDLQLKASPVKRPILTKMGFLALKGANFIKNIFRDVPREGSDVTLSSIDRFAEGDKEALEEIQEEYNFIVQRSPRYLNWRYCDPRGGEFRVRIAEDGGEAIGYSVSFINRYLEGYPIGYIIDVLTPPDRVDVMEALVSDVVNFFDENGINMVNTIAVNGHPLEKALSSHGFVDTRISLKIFLGRYGKRAQDQELKNILRESPSKHIHFSYGDIDSIPVTPPDYTKI